MQPWRSLPRSQAWHVVGGLCALATVSALLGSPASLAQTTSVAPQTSLLLPSGVAYDAAGNLFVADTRKNQVFEVSLAGMTTVIAGTGEQGFSGDGGAATLALLNGPTSIAVAADGAIYIADTGNQRVRAVVSGQIQTVAGNGLKGFSGDGSDARLARLNAPLALAIDSSGSLLIADSNNHRLRRLSAGVLTTIAGNGIQGYAGDGSLATLAEMDTPAGIAVAGDGRIFVADSHNHRIRVIAADGNIATFAGSGNRGFSGDGAEATGASLFLPRGVAVRALGDVVFADSDNQRLRSVNVQGVITTIAGDGVQGISAAGAAANDTSLDSPRGIALSNFATLVFADAHNHVVQEVAADAKLYELIGSAPVPVTVALSTPAGWTYGQGTIGVSVSGAAPVAQGSITLLDGSVSVNKAMLVNAAVMFSGNAFSAGQHTLTAAFDGDVLHPAATSPAMAVGISPALAIATTQAVKMVYGGVPPSLSGTIVGILPRDAASVTVNFASGAPDLSPPGEYPIIASLSGLASPNYTLTLDPTSGLLQIVQAEAIATMALPQISYAGLPLIMTATVSTATRGAPTGNVHFLDNSTIVGTGDISNGVASAVYLNPSVGSHSISVAYDGDRNFLAATSTAAVITVGAMPDFAMTVTGNTTQTVQAGAIANYALQVSSASAPFSGAVSLSASGLPTGAVASFSPTAVIPGNNSVAVSLTIETTGLAMRSVNPEVGFGALLVFGLSLFRKDRRRGPRMMRLLLVAAAMAGISCSLGCGDRMFSASTHASQSFPITVTATSTNLAGKIVVHTASVMLVVQ